MRLDKIHGDWSSRIVIVPRNLGILHRIDNFMTKSIALLYQIQFLIWDVTKVGTISWKIGFPIKRQVDRRRSIAPIPPPLDVARAWARLNLYGSPVAFHALPLAEERRSFWDSADGIDHGGQFLSNEVPRKRSFDLARGSREEVGSLVGGLSPYNRQSLAV